MIAMEELPQKKKSLSFRKNRKVPMEFAENHLQKGSEFWKTVLFADDNKCNVFGSYRHNYVWGIPGEALRAKNIRPTAQHVGDSVMV